MPDDIDEGSDDDGDNTTTLEDIEEIKRVCKHSEHHQIVREVRGIPRYYMILSRPPKKCIIPVCLLGLFSGNSGPDQNICDDAKEQHSRVVLWGLNVSQGQEVVAP